MDRTGTELNELNKFTQCFKTQHTSHKIVPSRFLFLFFKYLTPNRPKSLKPRKEFNKVKKNLTKIDQPVHPFWIRPGRKQNKIRSRTAYRTEYIRSHLVQADLRFSFDLDRIMNTPMYVYVKFHKSLHTMTFYSNRKAT